DSELGSICSNTWPDFGSQPLIQASDLEPVICSLCLCGIFCFYCLGCQVASDMNECCLCGGSVAMRTLYRTRYGIPGSICSDFCTTLWCSPCSLCQIKRDIRRRKEMGIF
uniref:PLAC8 protein n=1 Tax=Chelydra serpentina TaxID=8475 RepID=A0A8C3RW48_CHESE